MICPNTAPLFFNFCRCNSKFLTVIAAKNIKSDCHVETIVILLYVKWDSATVESRVVREMHSLQCAFLKYYVTFIQKL